MGLREIFEQFADSTGVHGLKVRKSQIVFFAFISSKNWMKKID